MRRVVCSEIGDPARLRVVEQRTPVPGPGEVVIQVEAAAVGYADGLLVRGGYQTSVAPPFTPGSAVTGSVLALGDGVACPAAGTRVAASLPALGGYATHVVAPAALTLPLPEGVGAQIAASAMDSYAAVVFAISRRVRVAPGERVVVLGAGGGIGLAAVDVARALGAHVVAVASTPEKRDAARAAGAETAIAYADLKNAIRDVTGGGADVVLDPVGGTASEAALRALRPDGRLCVLGFASGEIPRLPANVVLLRNRTIVGVDYGGWVTATATIADRAELVSGVLDRIGTGELRPGQPSTAPLSEAGRVLELMAQRRVTGRHVLIP